MGATELTDDSLGHAEPMMPLDRISKIPADFARAGS